MQRASDEEDNLLDSISDTRGQANPGSDTDGQPSLEGDTQDTGHTPRVVVVDAPPATGDVSLGHVTSDTSPVAETLAPDKTEECTGAGQVGSDLYYVMYVHFCTLHIDGLGHKPSNSEFSKKKKFPQNDT